MSDSNPKHTDPYYNIAYHRGLVWDSVTDTPAARVADTLQEAAGWRGAALLRQRDGASPEDVLEIKLSALRYIEAAREARQQAGAAFWQQTSDLSRTRRTAAPSLSGILCEGSVSPDPSTRR